MEKVIAVMVVIVISYLSQGCNGVGYGDDCTDAAKCTDTNTVCDADTGKCGCDTEYTRNSDNNACMKNCPQPPTSSIDSHHHQQTLIQSCPQPPSPGTQSVFASSSGTPYVFGSTATYTCNTGYQSSSLTISCPSSGIWPDAPTCTIKNCPQPPTSSIDSHHHHQTLIQSCPQPPSPGTQSVFASSSGTPYVFGSTATYTCNTGYQSSSLTITCPSSGIWPDAPTCTIKSCPQPPSPGTQSVFASSSGTPYVFGSTATYTCNTGYESSSLTITCPSSGTWPDAPTCTVKNYPQPSTSSIDSHHHQTLVQSCPQPPSPGAQSVFATSSGTPYVFGSTATYTCNIGYESSSLTITCPSSGTWPDAPTCTIKSCPQPPSPGAQSVFATSSGTPYVFGSTATYTCNIGYESSSLTITCPSSGTWPDAPTCTIKSCPQPPSPGAQSVFATSSGTPYVFGSTATYTCNIGYESSSLTITCPSSGTWPDAPTCTIKSCPQPPSPGAQSVFATSSGTPYVFGSTATYTCNIGYESSSLTITCPSSGTWPDAPTCTIKSCPNPPLNGTGSAFKSKTGNNYEDTATYECDTGYETSSSLTIKCTGTKVWESTPTCKIKNCSGPPSAMAHSALISWTGTTYGSTASYTCDKWYSLSSSSLTIQCTASGVWQAAPTCAITKNGLGSGCPNPSTGITTTESCGDNKARCTQSGESYTCQCLSQYYDNNGSWSSGTCVSKKILDDSCPRPSTTNVKASDSCSDSNAECVYKSSSLYQCKCTSTYYNKDGSCTPKVNLGISCLKSDACATSNAQCISGTCLCTSGYYDDNGSRYVNGNCIRKVGLGKDCPMPDACDTGNAECSGNKCKCKEEYYDSNTESTNGGTCLLRKDLNAPCNTQSPYNLDQCKDLNALCTSDSCQCNAGYHPEASTCVPDAALGGECQANVANVCSDPAAICSNTKCICGDNHYDSNGFDAGGNCKDMRELKVGGVTFSSISTTAFTVGWTPPADKTQYINSYTLEWRPTDNTADGGGSESLQSTAVSRTIPSNIISGRAYRVTITSRNDQTQTGVGRFTSVSKEQATKPQKPGPLRKTSDINITSNGITIDWHVPESSASVARDYYVEIFDGTESKANKTVTSASADISFENMRYGYTYKIQITANSQQFDGNHVVPSDVYMAEIMTLVIAPKNPTDVLISDVLSRSFTVTWHIEDPWPGNTTYTIMVYGHPDISTSKNVIIHGFEQRSSTVQELQEFWNYSVAVKASTSAGSETSDTTEQIKTSPAAPGKVSDFKVETPNGDYTKLQVTWKIPPILQRNSKIVNYTFTHNATDAPNSPKELGADSDENKVFKETVVVDPEQTYSFQVNAVNEGEQQGEPEIIVMKAPAGVPKNDVEDVEKVTVIAPPSDVEQTKLKLSIKTGFYEQSRYGRVVETGLLICAEENCWEDKQSITLQKFKSSMTWNVASGEGFPPYRPTKESWQDDQNQSNGRKKRAAAEEIDFVVGAETCLAKSTAFCNGPLVPDTPFIVYAVVCTNGGCLLSNKYGPFRTAKVPEDGPPVGVIGGVCGAVVALIVIGIIVFIMYRRRRQTPTMKPHSGKEETFVASDPELATIQRSRPQRLSEFNDYLTKMHKDTNLLFSSDYDDLKKISPNHAQDAANREENRLKNRYINILPFDHTRVKLYTNGEDDREDYINANYLPGYSSPREYIGCQGPIPGTIDDFWRMVWEQNVSVIVMLTLCKEGQKVKCEQYWPNEVGDPKQYGDVVVEVTSSSTIKTYDYKIFKLGCGSNFRTVKHFHFLSWLDFQANVKHDVILDFITHVRTHIQPPDTQGPIIVHCSAGVGRTGTYIALDHLIQFINEHDDNAEIDIFDMVLKLRENRPHMVQTEQQYIFIHDSVKEIMERKNENIYQNEGFEQEENLYENTNTGQSLYANVQMKTEL